MLRGRADDGATVLVDAPQGLAGPIGRCWPPLGLSGPEPAAAVGADGDAEVVRLDPATFDDGRPTERSWARLESDLALFAADHLVGRVAVHAALVTWRDRTILLPGPSLAGKSTLALALSDQGATVWTDEYALVDPASGRAVGWPRPVRRRRADGGIDRVVPPVPAGADRSMARAIDLVALLRFDPAGGGPSWTPLEAADVVQHLLANSVSARRHPSEALDAALAVARSAVAVEGARGDAAEAAEALLERLGDLDPSDPSAPADRP